MGKKDKNNKGRQQRQLKKQQRAKNRRDSNIYPQVPIVHSYQADPPIREPKISNYEKAILKFLGADKFDFSYVLQVCYNLGAIPVYKVTEIDKLEEKISDIKIEDRKRELLNLENEILIKYVENNLTERDMSGLLGGMIEIISAEQGEMAQFELDPKYKILYQYQTLLLLFSKMHIRDCKDYDELYKWLNNILKKGLMKKEKDENMSSIVDGWKNFYNYLILTYKKYYKVDHLDRVKVTEELCSKMEPENQILKRLLNQHFTDSQLFTKISIISDSIGENLEEFNTYSSGEQRIQIEYFILRHLFSEVTKSKFLDSNEDTAFQLWLDDVLGISNK